MIFRRILKWVLWSTALLLMMALLVAAGLFFTPNLVSTDWFRHQLETRSSRSLHRNVTVGELQWTWREGIRIKGLRVADDPRYGTKPILSVDQLLVFIDFELSPGRLLMDLEADGLKANLIREKDGRTNLEAWLAQLKPPSKPTEPVPEAPGGGAPTTPFILPGDLTAKIKLTHAQVGLEDRLENRLLEVSDGFFTLDMPSLLSKPVDIDIRSSQSMDEKVLPPLDLSVHVDGLVNDSGSFDPKAAMLQVNGELPGLHVAMAGSMAQKGLKGEVDMDLAPLAEAVKPLMPATLPRLSGKIRLQTKAKLQGEDMIDVDLTLACTHILASGGPLKEKEIGPFSITLSQQGSVALHDKTVTLMGGDIHLMEKSGLSFKGRMKLEAENRVNVNLTLDKVALHLAEIQALAEGFIPKGVQLKGMGNAQHPDFAIGKVQLSGILPNGGANLTVKDVALNLSRLHLALSKDDSLKLRDLTLSVPRTAVQLKNRFPETVALRLSLGAKNVNIPGKHPLSLDECRISSLNVALKDLAPSPKALWGVTGQITFQESGLFRGVRLPPRNDGTDRLSHSFKVHMDLPAAPRAGLVFAEADLSTALLKLSSILPRPLKEGLALKGRLKDVLITQLNPLKVNVAHLEADVDSGDVLALHLEGAALDSGMTSFRTEGRMSMDLGRASNLAPAGLLPKGKFTGRVNTRWQLQGRRPIPKEMAGLTDQTLSLERRMGNTRFLEELEIETELLRSGAVLPLPSGETLSLRGIHSKRPFRISTANGLTTFSMGGELKVDNIKGLPSLEKLKDPLGALLSLNAESRNLNSLEVQETLQLASLGVNQNLELSLNKLNRLLRQREKPDLTTLLKMLEAEIKAGININTGPGLAPFTRGATLEGPLKGSLALRLRGGKSISLKTSLESDGINGALPSRFSVSDLKTRLQFEKTYGLKFGPLKEKTVESVKALSRSVLRPEGPRMRFSGVNPLSQRMLEDLRGRLLGEPTLSFTECRLEAGPFPMRLKNARMQMRFNRSLPSVDYFQMGVMGGTVLGALRILEHENQYHLEMTGDFSGLDANRLLQGGNAPPNEKEIPGGSQISGRMSFRVPITAHAGTVMGNLNAAFRLTHIGARTLERFLYAMDPHENNESIVRQRALLKKGTPRWIEVIIRNGSLSLTGEVALGGTTIRLPAIKRLNLASLPIQKQIQTLAHRLVPLLKGFKILSANTLWVEPDGAIDFREDVK